MASKSKFLAELLDSNGDVNTANLDNLSSTLGTASTNDTGDFLQVSNNLSDLNNAATARISLGLGTAATEQSINLLVPAGAVMAFAMNAAPTGWLICDGLAISRTTYASLFSAIGTLWGVGDGSTSFNLPNLNAAFLRGSGSGTINGRTKTGGSVGDFLEDQGQIHQHSLSGVTGTVTMPEAGGSPFTTRKPTGANSSEGGQGTFTGAVSLSGNTLDNNDRNGSETRPYSATVLYCIKY